uniref:Palmitoyltransferase n=1 Tax=Arcella intermedia TaxID=1963864 RepID=A0A6B2L0R6_9EUKA
MNEIELVRSMMEQNSAFVHEVDSDNVTPLHWAALDNHMEVANLLVQAGARLDVFTNLEGHSPLDWACIRGNLKMILFLISCGATIDRRDKRGYHALHHCVMYNHLEAAFYLLHEYHLDVEMTDDLGHTLLMWASYSGFVPMMRILLREHADVTKTDKDGKTALQWAACKGRTSAVELLLRVGADHRSEAPINAAKDRKFFDTSTYLEIARNNPSVRLEGRKAFKHQLYFLPFFFVPWVFFSFAYAPFLLLSFLLMGGPIYLIWKHYLQVRWINDTEDRNPFYLGIFISSYLLSITVYFTVLLPAKIPTLQDIYIDTPEGKTLGPDSYSALYFILFNLIWFISYMGLLYQDPGIIPKDSTPIKDILAGLRSGKGSYCVTCQVRRPLRSKHCRSCDQCVARFDHYCPWINNDVGYGNHRLFLVELLGICINHWWFINLCSDYLAFTMTDDISSSYFYSIPYVLDHDPVVFLMILYHFLFGLWQSYNLFASLVLISINLTTNENLRKKNYPYLWKDNKFFNLWHRGVLNNIYEFVLHRVDYYNTFDVYGEA